VSGLRNGSSTAGCRMVIRQLSYDAEDGGYQVICDAVDWQKAKGIRLWDTPPPREVYARRLGQIAVEKALDYPRETGRTEV